MEEALNTPAQVTSYLLCHVLLVIFEAIIEVNHLLERFEGALCVDVDRNVINLELLVEDGGVINPVHGAEGLVAAQAVDVGDQDANCIMEILILKSEMHSLYVNRHIGHNLLELRREAILFLFVIVDLLREGLHDLFERLHRILLELLILLLHEILAPVLVFKLVETEKKVRDLAVHLETAARQQR